MYIKDTDIIYVYIYSIEICFMYIQIYYRYSDCVLYFYINYPTQVVAYDKVFLYACYWEPSCDL